MIGNTHFASMTAYSLTSLLTALENRQRDLLNEEKQLKKQIVPAHPLQRLLNPPTSSIPIVCDIYKDFVVR